MGVKCSRQNNDHPPLPPLASTLTIPLPFLCPLTACYTVNFIILLYFTVPINTRTVYNVHSAVSSPELKDKHHMTTKILIHILSFSEAYVI
jgi:hypothetical protein